MCQNTNSEAAAANTKPKCQPAVKFRNIDENALHVLQTGDQNVLDDGIPSEHEDEPESGSESEDETGTSVAWSPTVPTSSGLRV